MIIGVPKEIKSQEFRVGIVPAGVRALSKCGHKVIIQNSAGEGSGILDEEYIAAGAEIRTTAKEIFEGVISPVRQWRILLRFRVSLFKVYLIEQQITTDNILE